MRKSRDATTPGGGRRERQGNGWIKSLLWIDLEGMSRSLRAGRSALSRALKTRGRLREKPTDDLLAFDKRHGKMLLAKGQYLSSPSQNLNLRPSSIWLFEGENDLRTWPPGCEVALQCGHEKALAGHLPDAFSGLPDAFFGLADMAISRWRPCPPGRVWGEGPN